MYTEHDEGRGLVKTHWAHVRDRVHKVNPEFAALVDEIDPGKELPLFLAYYRYGDLTGDTENPFMPNMEGGLYRLDEHEASNEVFKHLGYGTNSAPLSMILEKAMEIFADLPGQQITIPRDIYLPGAFFPVNNLFFITNQRRYVPNGILSGTAGARSVFLLPNIGSINHHAHLQRDFDIQSAPTKSLHQHHTLFKELANYRLAEHNWRFCLLLFSEKFLQEILQKKPWLPVKNYILQYGWNKTTYDRCQFYYDVVFSTIQKKRNLKPNPFVFDIVKHLCKIALGVTPGFIPLTTDDFLPLEALQTMFIESYNLTKHTPTIMGPCHYGFEKDKHPVYFSLQNTAEDLFSPTSRTSSSTVFEIRELAHLLDIFQKELSSDNSLCADTVLKPLMQTIEFSYYHNRSDQYNIMRLSTELESFDKRFRSMPKKYKDRPATFASDSKFFRGCIAIKTKG